MRKWEVVLRHDTEAWDDFKSWFREIRAREVERLTSVELDKVERHRGFIAGIEQLFFEATSGEREELSRARRQA